MNDSDLTPPSAAEFYAIFRVDTHKVLWFELKEEDAEAKALAFSNLPEYRDVPISWTLCQHPDLES